MLFAVKNANSKERLLCGVRAAPAESKDTSEVQFLGELERQSPSGFAVRRGWGLKNALTDPADRGRANHGLRPSWGPPLRFLGCRCIAWRQAASPRRLRCVGRQRGRRAKDMRVRARSV